jgi:hypothetical protein
MVPSAGDKASSGAMTTPSTQPDEFGPWPLNIIGRQWKKANGQNGWHRAAALTRIGCELVLVVIVVVLLII